MNKLILVLLSSMAINSNAKVFDGGIPLNKTEYMTEKEINLPDANPKPVLALAMRHGHAKGRFTGEAEAMMTQKYGKKVPIYVEAKKIGSVKGQPECGEIQMTFRTTKLLESEYPSQTVMMSVCPNK